MRLDERINDMNFERQKMDLDLAEATSQLKMQDYLMKNYQDLVNEKNMIRRELASEFDTIRREKQDARRAILELRTSKAELEFEKQKAFGERREKELLRSKQDMISIMRNYLDYKSNPHLTKASVGMAPFFLLRSTSTSFRWRKLPRICPKLR